MNIEVVAIGNELLKGSTINSNAAYISFELFLAGYSVARHTVLPDDESILYNGLKEALARSQIVIATGGLGPTCDDRTKKIAAQLYGSEMHFDESIAEDLRKRYGNKIISLEHQATVPTKAHLLKNSCGTASGLVFQDSSSMLILMPGVPHEMQAMCTEQLIPYLKSHFSPDTQHYSRSLFFFEVTESQVDPILRQIEQSYPSMEVGVYPKAGMIAIELMLRTNDATKAQLELDEASKCILAVFEDKEIIEPLGNIPLAVQNLFLEKKLTLSTAESCTGGAIAASLVQIPGASNYFLGSIVAYSNSLKEQLLGVPTYIIEENGAVSEETAIYMLKGLLERTGSSYGIAITGVAGPDGGTPRAPVGTIWVAIGALNEKPVTWKFYAPGMRDYVIKKTVNWVLGYLYRQVKKN